MDITQFYNQLENLGEFQNTEIIPSVIDLTKVKHVTFKNCNFISSQVLFIDNDFTEKEYREKTIHFEDCSFNASLFMATNNFAVIRIFGTKAAKSFKILNSKIDSFIFQNNVNINYKLEISCCFFYDTFNLSDNIFIENGSLKLNENTFYKSSTIINNILSSILFKKQYFKDFLAFQNIFIDNIKSVIIRSEFEKVSFSESKFSDLSISNCDFLSTAWFENCKNINNSNLKFVACEFKGFSLFNNSKLNFLDVDRCTFDKSSSFTDAEFNSIKLFEVKFGGGAYFDEMKINNVINKSYLKSNTKEILEWKRTLRAIKQELQKTENKIDFNRFRAYELAAHYKELDWGWKENFKDKFILWATKWSTDFGNSWRRSLVFTLLSGLFWYSIFYYLDFYVTGNYQYYFNTNSVEIFGNGYFRFLLVTDFYNPLVEDRTYIQNFCSWIPFIFGKIFVAFGIYEMIQSFRKFKA